AAALETTDSLVTYWDTLGWVAFARGDLATAKKYVSAAWIVAEAAEVGDHLGQILEKEGRRDEAAAAYARALSAERPDPAVREHLVALVGAARADARVAARKQDLLEARQLAIGGKGPAGKTADFFVVFAAPGKAEGVQFIDG